MRWGRTFRSICACGDPQQFRYRYDQSQWNGRDMPVIVPEVPGSCSDVERRGAVSSTGSTD